mmetsp:Transcript_12335/g.39308  ORF Transcript_12335/g.39308 Transcript_12335/m.39308 type:complete len:235 (+) Transcript_12335:66-770(+)
MGRAPSAAWWATASCSAFVSGSRPPSVAARSCCTLTPVAARPGSLATAAPSRPAAARRRWIALVSKHAPAFDFEYWSHGEARATAARLLPRSARRSVSLALKRAPEDCAATRTKPERLRSGSSSAASSAWPSRLTCMITSAPSTEAALAPEEEPPRPAFRTSVSIGAEPDARMCAPKARTDAKEPRSSGTSGTTTTASGTAAEMAAAAEAASWDRSGRLGRMTVRPTRQSSLAT